jgi:hypothetical protein|tara:strand:- start:1688 stop:2032 length:345 start_codon:yes stop_codon:yes gene_type:complete
MTNSNTTTTRPVVKLTNPELYVQHTFHMKRAGNYTYNYSGLDDYILENWASKTIREISDETNEYFERVVYRTQVLKAVGLIAKKRSRRSPVLMRKRKMLAMWLKEIDAQLEGVA